ncbi:MAG: tRNA (adenosine(37)-N6)-threonylcarbamoyltransferase complex ATPase subunit type 1 TsaE [Patiriisocius sp.]|uniref:tRNA (adenosine(37)-N6)-threonylcarbamoyltransferase complex ATPase subunit type 1 TsaE n=1 Tax=Patiriisocius sp. TaxID=2822396 RepID=UPI003EF5A6AC
MKLIFTAHEIPSVAKQVIDALPSKTVLFYGQMGVGKTTLIKEIAKQLGVTTTLTSPTFSIVNEYETASNDMLYHFDCYRIEDENEALDFGIEEYLSSGNYNFIEWPEKISSHIPVQHTVIKLIKNTDGSRTLTLEPVK